jgi:hypothetical protein
MTALASAVVVSAFAGTSAFAFDGVRWTWDKTVKEHVDIDVDINVCVDPDGLVEIEKLQIFLGDVNAESKVAFVNVDMYDPGGHWDWSWCWYPVYIPNAFDARVDLGAVVSTATAVGNNQSITSDVPVFLHDGQFVANVNDERDGGECTVYCDSNALLTDGGVTTESFIPGWEPRPDSNTYTTLAALFTIGAVLHVLTPSDISASSQVFAIHNATVDSSATAVANNISVNLESDNPDNHVLIADITQFAYANVSAVSDVCGVEIDNFKNLSPDATNEDSTLSTTLGRPIVSSVATAVGNNVSITVGVPTP